MISNEEKSNVWDWFKIARDWDVYVPPIVSQPGNPASQKSPILQVSQQMLEQIRDSHENNNPNQHFEVTKRLELLLKDNENAVEKAQIYQDWGAIEMENGDHRDALLKLKSSLELYTGKYDEHAITLFLIGCVEWLIPERRNQSLSSFSRAANEFKALQQYHGKDEFKDKYESRQKWTEQILSALIKNDKFPPVFPDVQKNNNAQNVPPASFKVWEVLEVVPAGGFGTVGTDRRTIADVYIPQVEINKELFDIFHLKPGYIVNLTTIRNHIVVKVSGDSMNQTAPPILDGDYLLIKIQQQPEQNDIVLTVRQDIDTLANVKRYKIVDGRAVLRPESNNPKHKAIAFDPAQDLIEGIAVAVFKKATTKQQNR